MAATERKYRPCDHLVTVMPPERTHLIRSKRVAVGLRMATKAIYFVAVLLVLTLMVRFKFVREREIGNVNMAIFASIGVLLLVWVFVSMLASIFDVEIAEELLAADPRPPVLYLRSFRFDRGIFRTSLIGDNNDGKTVEQALFSALHDVGPFVAIGKPGERFTAPGAAKLYVDDEHWQEQVLQFMERSRAIIIVQGKTAGLEWELASAIRTLDPIRLLLVIPAKNKGECGRFRASSNLALPHPLPECPLGVFRHKAKWPELFMFDSSWVPQTLPRVIRRFPKERWRSFDFKASLAPFIERL